MSTNYVRSTIWSRSRTWCAHFRRRAAGLATQRRGWTRSHDGHCRACGNDPSNTGRSRNRGGCVEGALATEPLDIIESGKPKTLEFGVAAATAWKVGLSCGGTIRVYVEK